MIRICFFNGIYHLYNLKYKKIEEMIYSPKKDIQRYVSLKSHEIKNLKQELGNEKITEESVQNARKKLEKLKGQHDILVAENHQELINTLKKAEQQKKMLQDQAKIKEKSVSLKKSEENEIGSMRNDLISKIEKAKSKVHQIQVKREALMKQKNQADKKILQIVKENESQRAQNLEIRKLQKLAKAELSSNEEKFLRNNEINQQLERNKKNLGSKLLRQKQELISMKSEAKLQELKVENLQLRLGHLSQIKSTLHQKKESLMLSKLQTKQISELNRIQSQSFSTLSALEKITEDMKLGKERQLQSCKKEIKQGLVDLQVSECLSNELASTKDRTQGKITSVDERLRKMEATVFGKQITNDNQLISIIVGKPSQQKKTSEDAKSVPLKQFLQDNKQNNLKLFDTSTNYKYSSSAWSKLNSLEMAETAAEEESKLVS